ncbi:glycosyltransferase family 9 protein [Lysobacter auxotrophicus]|uniref:Glycosyltransferase family 9 protein n=1 Tax=Lysobacter auxotrophicus TaxID=2992573 RepID=A0ABN6UJ56_9GAMM|nr:glycosyltransferase family 9 protein [Lysobacter auxotrophicus]BDU16266.1 glycosyltransferase family 9 protein [Lysobacter auxotrophicus]
MSRDVPRPAIAETEPPAHPAAVPDDAARTRSPVLVIRHGAFGDLLQADGALRDLREHHRDRHIALLASSPYTRLMSRCPHVDEVIADPRAPLLQLGRNLSLLRTLRERGFERVYDLQGSDRTALYRRLMPETPQWLRKHNPSGSGTPDRLAYAWMLAQAGIRVRHADAPDPAWMAEDAGALLAGAGVPSDYIVLIPGSAARHAHKRWPGHAALARRLGELGHAVVVVPGPDELELARSLPCHVLTRPDGGFLDWFALAGVLQRAAFVVGNDTGPTHLAAALGVPGLALFGSHTSVERTGIRMRAFEAIQVSDLAQLPVETVLADVLRRLPHA